MLCSVAGCGAEEAKAPETSAAAVTEAQTSAEKLSDDVPELDYSGYTFKMLMRNDTGWIADMYSEELNGEIMNDAIYKRNLAVSERFNLAGFEVIKSSNPNLDTDGIKTILAGDDAYDIIVAHARATFIYAMQNVLIDWYGGSLTYIDLSKPWWDSSAAENLSVNNHLYTMTGDISYRSLGATNSMLFNMSIFDALGIAYPYDNVEDGTWTFGLLTQYAQQGTSDLNGDGVIKLADDQIGYVTDEWIGPIQVLYSGNQRIVSKDENDMPYLSLNTPKTIEIYEKYFSLIDSDYGHCAKWEELDTGSINPDGIFGRFINNQAMFLDANIRQTIFLRDMDANFGIVPWPKFDESVDNYYSNVDAGCNMIIIPVTASDPARTSAVLEALSSEGYENVVPAYYDVALSTKYARDEQSIHMLDLVRENRVYDLGYYDMNLDMFNSMGEYMFINNKRDFGSLYAKQETSAIAHLKELAEAFSD